MLVVEIKGKFDAAPEWAARLRRNILAHGFYPNAPFSFLLFLINFIYGLILTHDLSKLNQITLLMLNLSFSRI